VNHTPADEREPVEAVTPYGPMAGSSRVRVFDWVERIPETVVVHPYAGLPTASPRTLAKHPGRVLNAELDLRRLRRRRPSRLLLHREASPLSRGGQEAELLGSAGFSVYDLDDALFCDVGQGPRYRRLAPKAAKARLSASAADRVIAGNDVIAEWASTHNRDVVIIPSCVDPASYDEKKAFALHDPPRIGWVGSWSTEKHLLSMAAPLQALNAKTGARVTLIGATKGAWHPGLGDLESIVDRVPWSLAAQKHEVAQFDVAVMPLIDDCYARGKCGYKLLQYLAAGVPAVASPIGVNSTILSLAGLPAATTDDEWYDALLLLLSTPTADRESMGAKARRTASDHYSFDAWKEKWKQATEISE
jgi:glycosyltransferase involved in cell wall biosynthesis